MGGLNYWKVHKDQYPVLSLLARRYLAIPATSAAIERIFSISSNIITKSRNNLNPETVRMLMLLKNWRFNSIKDLERDLILDENSKGL